MASSLSVLMPGLDGGFPNGIRRCAGQDQFADFVCDRHQFIDADSALVARPLQVSQPRPRKNVTSLLSNKSRFMPRRLMASAAACTALCTWRKPSEEGAAPARRRPTRRSGTTRRPCPEAGRPRRARRWCAAWTGRDGRSSAASMAISAVSLSRISPTMMMFGSWRSMERKARRERHVGPRVDHGLRDPVQLIFHGVFDG